MSWFGDSISSISGKLQDISKAVNENIGNSLLDVSSTSLSPGRRQSSEEKFNIREEVEDNSVLLEDQEQIINQLIADKEDLEKKIILLDEQHEEALKELLQRKCELASENKRLKTRLLEKEKTEQNLQIPSSFEELKNLDDPGMSNPSDLVKNLNVITLLVPFRNCQNKNTVEDQISKLQKLSDLLQSGGDMIEPFNAESVCKINNYIEYLRFISEHEQKLLPFMQEVANLLCKTVCDGQHNAKPIKDVSEGTQIQPVNDDTGVQCDMDVVKQFCCRECQTESVLELVKNELEDSSAVSCQTELLECQDCVNNAEALSELSLQNESLKQKLQDLHQDTLKDGPVDGADTESSCQTDLYECSSCARYEGVIEEMSLRNDAMESQLSDYVQKLEKECYSSSCQTDIPPEACQNCVASAETIIELERTNASLRQEASNSLQKHSIESMDSVALQTEGTCECEALKTELQKTAANVSNLVKEMQKEKEDLLLQLEQKIELAKTLSKALQDREHVVASMESIVFSKTQDIASLRKTIDVLEAKLASSTNPNPVPQSNNIESPQFVKTEETNSVQSGNLQDQLSMSVSDNDKLLLQQKLKTLDLEKNRLLSVLSDKSRECSSLKSEVHRLTSIVASEKQALLKLQQDNKDLKECKENGLDPDLTREALQNLSQLVRSKDLEIEALKQKNTSLSEVVKQTCSGSDQLQALVEEREDLLKQINQFKANRDKIMASYNNKDQECRSQLSEMKTLKSELDSRARELDLLQTQYSSISQQYEEKQKALIEAQNEVIVMRQKLSEAKQNLEELEEKHNELLNQINSDSVITISKDDHSKLLNELEDSRASIQSKEKLITEKDSLIHDLSQQIKSVKLSCGELEKSISEFRKGNENLKERLNEKQEEAQKILIEKELLNDRLNDKQSESNLLREMNERLSMTLKEKEFSVQSLEEKINSLSKLILGNAATHNSENGSVDIDQILADSKDMFTKAQHFHRERDETLLALSQSQQENQELKNEVQRLKKIEEHLKSELDRLRKHLLQIEENYTNEALRAEEREKELRNHLAELEKNARLSNTASMDASHQASVQISSLQEQISIIAKQRDQALGQLSELEDKVHQYAASLSNLQLVLEQLQKVHDQKTKELERQWNAKLENSNIHCLELQRQLEKKQAQLEESSQALEAASRLSEQLDAKEEVISHLKEELTALEKKMKSTAQEIDSIKSNSEGKVDRTVMKSLVLGYFSTPPGQKSEVVRLLARVLDFNQEEMAKAGIVVSKNSGTVEHKGIFSSFLGRLPSLGGVPVPRPLPPPSNNQLEVSKQSLASLFIKFLENESQPVVHMPLPAAKMARELTSKAHSSKNASKTHSSTSSTPSKSPLLVGIDAAFPNFGPFPAIEHSTPGPTILKRVLD